MRKLVILLAAAAALSGAATPAAVWLGHWSTKAPMPLARTEAAVAVLDGRIYVIGGFGPGADQRAVQVYDAARDRWSLGTPLPVGLNHAGALGVNGKLYVFGGFRDVGGASADCYVFDPATARWTSIAPLPSPRAAVAVVEFAGVSVVGGNAGGSIRAYDVYSPGGNSWTSRAPLPVGRDHLGAAAVGGKLYAIGGRINDHSHKTSYNDAYDQKTRAWTSRARMPTARSGIAAVVYHGEILVIGGEDPHGVFVENEAYNPQTDSWATLAPLPSGRHGTGAVTIGDSVYLPGGGATDGGSQPTNTLFVYTR